MKLEEIKALPIGKIAAEKSHLYLWVPNALLPQGLEVMRAWGFEYKTNIIWEKFVRTACRTAAALVFILGMSPKFFCLELKEKRIAPLIPADRRST